MPHNRNNSVGLELTVPVEKRDQQSDRGDNSVSMIPFPEIVTNIPDIEQQPDQEEVNIEVPTITNTNVKPEFTPLIKRLAKFFIFLVVVGVLFYGRFNVPDNPVPCIIDKILDGLKVPNDFILAPGNESYRRGFQILGSLLIDLTFLTTFIYWIAKGTSLRLPLTLGVFYVVRAINQLFWFSPYPEGFYWDDPGFPSLVVPYGRGSDFFFSGHSGFVVICAREMFAYKLKKTSAIMWAVLAYTVMCLLIYRIHYSIDIFVGVFFADWCFIRAEQVCNKLVDPLCYKILVKLKHRFFKRKNPEANGGAQAQAQAQTQSQNQVQAKNHK